MKSWIGLIVLLMAFTAGAVPSIDLKQTEAEDRARRVSNVLYEWNVHLKKQPAEFTGDVHLFFDLSDNSKPLTLDFVNGEITAFEFNGAKVKPQYNKVQITLEKDLLVVGRNSVRIKYRRDYNRNGKGLTYFKDPKDGRVYLHTQFQTIDASQAFPCFDQPDIKAKYKMTVTAPQSWSVITSVKEKKVRYNRNKERVWTFPESALFSTYLLSLHAGPFRVWSDRYGKIPLRLYARRSLAKNVRPKDWFKYTKLGFKYFNKRFGYDYPFKKYDQLIVPEFNAGAMENVASVTFSERLVTRGKVTRSNRHRLAEIIYHEMAHMWFGNLVTMKWWNDLWLNESFATYMSYRALVETTDFKETWQKFFSQTKSWAYWEDQTVMTHPIEGEVPGTKAAQTIFDGITYGKGASVLKQLAYYIGDDAFKKGVQKYFQRYAYKNTVRAEFMAELAKASGKDLTPWENAWLKTSGVNGIKVEPHCSGDQLKSLEITQTKDVSSKVYRPHRFQVALLNTGKKGLEVSRKLVADIDGASQTIQVKKGTACPEMVYPNYEDYGYFRAQLDTKTVENLFTMIPKVKEVFLREMFWATLWDMVREGELSIYKYAELVVEQGLNETDINLLRTIQRKIFASHSGDASIEYYLPKSTPAERQKRQEVLANLENRIYEKLKSAPEKSDLQVNWFGTYVDSVRSSEGQTRLVKYLKGQEKVKGLKLDQDKRWGLVYALAEQGHPETRALLAVESKSDVSNRGKNSALSVKVRLASLDEKKKYINEVLQEKNPYSFKEQRAILGSVFSVDQLDQRMGYAKEFYSNLKKLMTQREDHFLRTYGWLQPQNCHSVQAKGMSEKFLEENKGITPGLLKSLKIQIQEDEKCRKIISKAQSDLKAS